MVREYPALVITDAWDLSKNSGNLAFAQPNLCPVEIDLGAALIHARAVSGDM